MPDETIGSIMPETSPRTVFGASAVLLPHLETGKVDWPGFTHLLTQTIRAGLVPALNMDTGYVHWIDDPTELAVLEWSDRLLPGQGELSPDRFIAGAVVRDQPGANFDYDGYAAKIERILSFGGTPIVFPSFGLNQGSESDVWSRLERLSELTDRFYAFELGQMFADCGRIYSLSLFEALLSLPACVGAKHSSLNRQAEWDRLTIRNRVRPEFRILTGNDLAIDMIKYGSDYLLGLSTMAPDLFALRDQFWAAGDARFYELNDRLQYLGAFTFRRPVPAYRHSAAQWLHIRGWLSGDHPHPQALRRPTSDIDVLRTLWDEVAAWVPASA